MKKFILFCVIALIGLVSCQKQAMIEKIEAQPAPAPAAKVTLNLKVQSASVGGETKAVKTAWATGDKLYLVFVQNGAITLEKAKKVILTYNAENSKWDVTDGQDALDTITGDGVVSGVYLAGGDFEWRELGYLIFINPNQIADITEAQKSDASAYSFSESTISATITLQQVGTQISISNISGNDWTITANEAEYQVITATSSILYMFNETILLSISAKTDGTLAGREEDGKVVFYGIPTGETKSVKLTISNSSTGCSYTKYFPNEKTIQVGKAINVKGPQLNPDGSVINDNGWLWNENPVTSTTTYTTSDGSVLPIPATTEEQIDIFGAPVISHEYNGEGTIVFRGNVTKIGDNAFKGVSNLQTMTIPEQVTSIGASAFEECDELSFINLPEGLESIDNDAFKVCRSLSSINLPEGLLSIGENAFLNNFELNGISIPSTVSHIGDFAFCNCSALSGTMTIPNGITDIGEGVFAGCNNITRVILPEGLKSIGNDAFRDCTSLSSINLPEGLLSIGESAFVWCEKLDGVNIPSTVTYIGNAAFSSCSALSGTMTIPNGVTDIGYCAFANTGITEIYLPEGLLSIGNLAFEDCQNLSSINLPDGLQSIDYSAFSGCSSLSNISIPSSVTSIGYNAFSSMSLDVITFLPATPPFTLDVDVFYESNVASIFVPAASVDAYKAVLGSLAEKVQGL